MQQMGISLLAASMQVSIAIAVNLIASYASTGLGSLLASQSDGIACNRPL